MEASAEDLSTGRRWATGAAPEMHRPATPPWTPVSRPRSLRAGEVHVIRASLDLEPGELDRFRACLSPAELERVGSLGSVDAGRTAAARGLLRTLLAGYLEVDPGDVPLVTETGGKPTLDASHRSAPLHFNHARSGGLGIYAVTGAGPVGVDLERVREVSDPETSVESFSSIERDTLRRLPPGLRAEGFHQCWTRKEALFKAAGGELPCSSLRDVDVSLTPGVPARVHRWRRTNAPPGEWTLLHLRPGPGFVGAVAVRGMPEELGTWSWERSGSDGS